MYFHLISNMTWFTLGFTIIIFVKKSIKAQGTIKLYFFDGRNVLKLLTTKERFVISSFFEIIRNIKLVNH